MRVFPHSVPIICVILFVSFLCAPVCLNSAEPGQAAGEIRAYENLVSVRKEPYLINPDDNTVMQILWQLDSTSTCTLDWGTDTLYSAGTVETSEYGDDHQHTYTIADLVPGTKHFYRVTVGEEFYDGSFYSATARDSTSVKFLVYGDTRTYPEDHDSVAAAMLEEYENDPGFQSFVLCLGDLISDGDKETDWDEEFFDPSLSNVREMFSGVPFHSAMGNHEESGILFQKYFPYPFSASRYWSFEYGPAYFLILDQYPLDEAQLRWIEFYLSWSSKPWKFVCFHEPGWSAGGNENDIDIQTYIQPLCEAYNVPIVFAGHNHYYARAIVNGVNHVTSGGGGAPLYEPDPSYPNIVSTDESFHYCKIEIDNYMLRFSAVRLDGTVIDSFTIDREPVGLEGEKDEPSIPKDLVLSQNYPNPFNPVTTIAFTLPEVTGDQWNVSLDIYDTRGRRVKTLFKGNLKPGDHSMVWNGLDDRGKVVASGIYLYKLRVGGEAYTRKMMILK